MYLEINMSLIVGIRYYQHFVLKRTYNWAYIIHLWKAHGLEGKHLVCCPDYEDFWQFESSLCYLLAKWQQQRRFNVLGAEVLASIVISVYGFKICAIYR